MCDNNANLNANAVGGNTKLDSRKNAETECYEERTLETGETYFEYTGKPIKVACSDKRPHRIVKLANNLEVFITQDETHEHAAAAMNVMVGFMHDPDELPGLAHFCEHMLFIGTTKYPEVDGFNAYLSKYEGMNNAFTAENRTCYYFTIANAGLEEALDRWAQFFISPLFQAEYVEREAKAVDSEFNNNINNDVWHAFRLNCLMSKLGHPVSKFNIGNYETLVGYAKLRGLDLREELVKFYEKYYSADIMKLAVVGSQSLDQLTEWVVKKFAPIKSRGNAVEPVEDPFGSEQVGKMARLKLNNEGYVLNLLFPLPNLRHMYRECPIGYVENLLSYEGEGSLFSYLEQKGWIKWISSYNHNLAGYSCNLVIAVSMTELGYKNYQKVICDIFSYINLLQQGQLSEEYFNDTKWKHHNQFEFSTPMKSLALVNHASNFMTNPYCPLQLMFVGDETWEEYSVDAISKVLDCLTPENLIVMVQTHDPSIEYEFRDQYFNMQYSVEPLDAALVEDIKAIEVHSDFKLPRPNQFMCHDLKPISDAEKPAVPATQPTLLIHNERGEVWHKKDDTFFTPKGALSIEFVLPKAVRELPGAMQLLETFKKLVERALRVPMDDAYLAGMSYHLQTSYNSMCVNIMGFTPKMMALAEVILKHIQFAGPQDLHFSIIKEEMLTDYNGFVNDEPDRQGVNWLREVLGLRTQNIEAKIKFIESMRLEDAQDFIRQALQNFYVKICGVGYFEEQTLLDIYSLVQTTFKPGTMPEDEICTPYFMLQKPGRHIIHKQSPNEHSCHSAIIHNIYPGNESNVKIAVYLDLVSSLAHSEMFTRLRTNETLGYIVGCGSSTTYSNFHYIRFEIVSKCNPVYLQLRLDKFYQIFRDEFLANLTQEDLDSRINASIKTLEQPYTSIYSEYMRYANAIDSDLYDFSCKQEMIEVLKRVTKQELLEFWDTKLAPLDPGRSPSLIAHVYSSKIHMPTLEDRQEYSAVICALHGCLEQSGIVGLGYADMCELVSRICEETTGNDSDSGSSSSSSSDSSAVEHFKAGITEKLPSVDRDALDKAFEPEDAFPRVALSMAIEWFIGKDNAVVSDCDQCVCYPMPDGDHVFDDCLKYRATLKLCNSWQRDLHAKPKYPEL